jgi:hypothetical protein
VAPAARPGRGRKDLLLELLDVRLHRGAEDLGQIAGRNRVTQQRLQVAQLVVCLLVHGELDREALRRQRREPRARSRRGNLPRGRLIAGCRAGRDGRRLDRRRGKLRDVQLHSSLNLPRGR